MALEKSKTSAKSTRARKTAAPPRTKVTASGSTPPRRRTSAAPRSPAGRSRGRGASTTRTPEPTAPSGGDIAVRAYFLYLERGAAHGSALEDWLQAEHELHT
ncbi:MAG: DUF2934 domain-containing protein [Acidobacteria bacterium]|nr:DUF2934 domain-containing protein [Acidobacteriota bacterium]